MLEKYDVLMTGGDGRLGTLLKQYFPCDTPTEKDFDITKIELDFPPCTKKYDLIVHLAAYTSVPQAEKEKEKCFNINVLGTVNLLKAFRGVPFVYISTEGCYNPVNYYIQTKLAGEFAVKAYSNEHLIIRTLFKPVPFPFPKAFTDYWTTGDEITVIAPLIAEHIKNWYENDLSSQTIHVGTGRKRIFDIAKKSRPDVSECSIKDIKDVVLPPDYQ